LFEVSKYEVEVVHLGENFIFHDFDLTWYRQMKTARRSCFLLSSPSTLNCSLPPAIAKRRGGKRKHEALSCSYVSSDILSKCLRCSAKGHEYLKVDPRLKIRRTSRCIIQLRFLQIRLLLCLLDHSLILTPIDTYSSSGSNYYYCTTSLYTYGSSRSGYYCSY
jgi:hypothetical protein